MNFDNYILTIQKRTVKISLPPDKDELEKAFWAGFKYCEELEKLKKDSDLNKDLEDIFGSLFKKK